MTSSCPHWASFEFYPPSGSTHVFREECTQCFDSQDNGLYICLNCFNAGCKIHALQHVSNSQHALVLYWRRRVKKQKAVESPPKKITKLQILADPAEDDLHDFESELHCFQCPNQPTVVYEDRLKTITQAIKMATSVKQKQDMKGWQHAEITPCEHTLTLEQIPSKPIGSHCDECDLKENLWLCLTCGNIGCGRRQYDGSGGNNHGVNHYDVTRHPVSCKLGTITAEGLADIYCYLCDDMKQDPELSAHLKHFGVNITTQSKSEKSVMELELEQNMKFDFSMVTEDGKALEPVYGPGLTGIKNIGNSCYMASVLQSMFSLPFLESYMNHHTVACTSTAPSNCYACQMAKMASGLSSGKYSLPANVPHEAESDAAISGSFQRGIPPSMLKSLLCADHPEFGTMRQQDAFEFFEFFLKTIEQKEKALGVASASKSQFEFIMTQRLQCSECKGVRLSDVKCSSLQVNVPAVENSIDEKGIKVYDPVSLASCLESIVQENDVEGFRCPGCNGKPVLAKTSFRFKSFPPVLVLHLQRFVLENWVPKKMNIPVTINEEHVDLKLYESNWPLPTDQFLPDTDIEASGTCVAVDPTALEQLEAMGFGKNRCTRALIATGNAGAEVAMEWLFSKMDDPALDDPLPNTSDNTLDVVADMAQVSQIVEMGFSVGQAKMALGKTQYNTERAIEWLFSHTEELADIATDAQPEEMIVNGLPGTYVMHSVISHKGTGVHAGHYVTFRYDHQHNRWILLNDEKVAYQPDPHQCEGLKQGYIYFLLNEKLLK